MAGCLSELLRSRPPRRRAGWWIIPLAALMLAGAGVPAGAHHQRSGGPATGVPIPSLTHGQMQVMASHRGAILALADDQWRTDPTFRSLRNYVALQHAACLWGLMPGSVSDEASPFNECSHADLAGLRALLLHMLLMPAAAPAAGRLRMELETEMLGRGEALVLCRFSDEPFNTADVIGPDWAALPTHGPTALLLGAALGLLGAAVLGGRLAASHPSGA